MTNSENCLKLTLNKLDSCLIKHTPFDSFYCKSNLQEHLSILVKYVGMHAMVFNANFQQYFSYIVAVSFIGGGNQSIQRKTTDLLQVTDKLYIT
jgi:hypothetical protein